MVTTKREAPLPFIDTHVANIADNRQIGLVFLLQKPARIFGLTELSQESLCMSQLMVGAWMIQSFLPENKVIDDVFEGQPWMEFEPFPLHSVEAMLTTDHDAFEKHRRYVQQIDRERMVLGERLWLPDQQDSLQFLRNIVAQVDECVHYTMPRVEAIKRCAEMPGGRGAIGYLAIKNAIAPAMMFVCDFLLVVQRIITDQATQRGYMLPDRFAE